MQSSEARLQTLEKEGANMQEIIISQDKEKNKIVALVENGKLVEKYEEKAGQERLEGNIYLGKVENVLLGMQAAFVDIGTEKNTFIHIKDVIPKVSNETGNKNETLSKYDIKNYIRSDMPILVQVKRDSTNKKGARVSTHISLPGRFIVLMPETDFITISKKIEKESEKKRLLDIVKNSLPKGYGAIIRTSAQGRQKELIEQDIQKVIQEYEDIRKKAQELKKKEKFEPTVLYENDGIIGKILTDLVDQELIKIVTNQEGIAKEVAQFLEDTGLQGNVKLELKQNENILSIYDIGEQIEKANNRKIWLKCGGFITIDKTEALTAIDVNSGKYIGNKDLEQTVYTVNKEASIEIAKQLRLRDIGGIVIIDYIDMEKQETKQKILETLEEVLKKDRSKTQVIGFTPLDLLEMTRKHMCSND
ncbi:MAG: Rne/Rng family ribonuclease [Clostridia bacterium]|nr:Rne/Rng family ribonuclease [Clostridia bacterium]